MCKLNWLHQVHYSDESISYKGSIASSVMNVFAGCYVPTSLLSQWHVRVNSGVGIQHTQTL